MTSGIGKQRSVSVVVIPIRIGKSSTSRAREKHLEDRTVWEAKGRESSGRSARFLLWMTG